MRKFAFVLLLCAAAFAQSITRSRISQGFAAIKQSDLKRDIEYLSSPELQGRLSLSKGSEEAVRWIASQFEKAGLKAIGGSYLQQVPLVQFETDRERSGITVHRNGSTETLHAPDAVVNFPRDLETSGSVVFAGFGITAPELNYDDYTRIDAHGKVVLIFDHEPQENDPKSRFNGKGSTRYAGAYSKTLNAQRHGAIGVLLVAEPNRQHLSTAERMAKVRNAQQRARIASQALADSAIQIPLFSISEKAADDLLGGQAKALQSAIDAKLEPQSKELDATTIDLKVVDSSVRQATSWNVAGLIEGSDPALRDETVIFSAHHDHDGPAPDGKYYPGADDNGSGTAGVVELARAFATNDIKPRRSLFFIVFTAEERGLLGSYYYVAHPLRPLDKTRAVVNFDMIGRDEKASPQTDGIIDIAPDTTNELNLIGTNYSPTYRATVERANNMIGLNLNYKWDQEPALNIFFRSDQYPFTLRDVPAVWWFTGFHPDYHQTTDTVEKIDFQKMQKILQLAYVAGFDFGDQPDSPKFKP
jgi:hypothetical protein